MQIPRDLGWCLHPNSSTHCVGLVVSAHRQRREMDERVGDEQREPGQAVTLPVRPQRRGTCRLVGMAATAY
jgi:hypothetical protein